MGISAKAALIVGFRIPEGIFSDETREEWDNYGEPKFIFRTYQDYDNEIYLALSTISADWEQPTVVDSIQVSNETMQNAKDFCIANSIPWQEPKLMLIAYMF